MKRLVILILCLNFGSRIAFAQYNTMSVFQHDGIVTNIAVNTIDSIVFYSQESTVKDIDGNTYHTVQIGSQTWLKENLRVTRYRDSTAIPLVENSNAWSNLTTPGMCYRSGWEWNYYGPLYNLYTINTNKLCPEGWHVPDYNEWSLLISFAGGAEIAGGKLKFSSGTHYRQGNWDPSWGGVEASNETGFSALPGGNRSNDGTYMGSQYYGGWWSSSPLIGGEQLMIFMSYNKSKVDFRDWITPVYGASVRCIKD